MLREEGLAVSGSFRIKSSDRCSGLWVLRCCPSVFEGLRGLLEIYGGRRSYSNETTIVAGHLPM